MAGPADNDKEALVAEIAAARMRLASTGESLRQSLDVAERTKESFKRHRPAWLGGAALVGLVLSKLPSRKTTVFVERATGQALGAAGKLGAVWKAAKFTFGVAGPLLSEVAARGLGEISKRFAKKESGNPPPQP